MAVRLEEAERRYFSTLSQASASKPFNQIKRDWFVTYTGAATPDVPFDEMELRWQIKYLANNGITYNPTTNSSELWRNMVLSLGLVPSKYESENQLMFYINGLLQSYIQSLTGLVAYYPFSDSASLNKAPVTLGSLNGTLVAVTTKSPGLVGPAYAYDGINSTDIIANNALLNLNGNGLTVAALINFTDAADNYRVMQKNGEYYMLNMESTDAGSRKIRFRVVDTVPTGHQIETDAGVPLGSWFWIIGTYDGATQKQYVNATVQVATVSAVFNLQGSTGDLGIGCTDTGAFHLKGSMQHVFICSAAITQAQITTLNKISGTI